MLLRIGQVTGPIVAVRGKEVVIEAWFPYEIDGQEIAIPLAELSPAARLDVEIWKELMLAG